MLIFLGLYGRLKDLATIDEKYNVAVTVSTGMLDYWVVDNDDTGTQCINLLKQRGMQFQNFVCLNRIKDLESAMKRRFDAPHNSQRLFDLLKVSNPDVNVAFYKALRDTLVCDNIDIASHIGYGKADGKRYRVTSLVGDLIEPSGKFELKFLCVQIHSWRSFLSIIIPSFFRFYDWRWSGKNRWQNELRNGGSPYQYCEQERR